jgi:hypothetical protein
MPLHKGKSDKVFKQNIKEMMAAGHSQAQSIAAAYHEKGESVHKGHLKKHHSKVEEVYNPEHAEKRKKK